MPQLSDVAMEVLRFRYLAEGETPVDMFRRVAKLVASAETGKKMKDGWQSKFFSIMSSLYFLPNTPTLINAGRPAGQLAACFVLPVGDSIPEIFDAIKNMAIVQKGGGGTGFSFSRLRPEGAIVEDTGGIASGPVSFMKVFDAATGEMKQGGVRRGANMGILRVDHPDIMKFIRCKNEEGSLSNFNISVGITDEFMECLENDGECDFFTLSWEGKDGKHGVEKKIDPHVIWSSIVNGAWKNGEPGILFLDRVNKRNPIPGEIIEGTNPCGEQPLPPNGTCNLGSIDVSKFVDGMGRINYDALRKVTMIAVRFLDNVIDVNHYPLEDIKREACRTRRIGLGIMGLADLFIKMKVRYGSDASLRIAEEIMGFIREVSWEYSEKLAKEKGIPPYLAAHNITRRNGALTTIAPTGSLSLIADCSSGCEPVFSFQYEKRCIDSVVTVQHTLFKQYIVDNMCPHKNLELPEYFVTAKEVPIMDHVKMQAVLQRHVDSGISKTINAPNSISKSNVSTAFFEAYRLGCNSIAFYREGSRKLEGHTDKSSDKDRPDCVEDLANSDSEDIALASPGSVMVFNPPPKKKYLKRPRRLTGFTDEIKTGRGKLYVTVNEFDGKPFEVFLKIGKSGRSDFAYSEALGRVISVALRFGVPIDKVIQHLRDISGDSTVWDYKQDVKSVPDAVSIILENKYGKVDGDEEKDINLVCPSCESVNVAIEGGCLNCKDCGFSKC